MGRTQITFEDKDSSGSQRSPFTLAPEFQGRLLDVHDMGKIFKVSHRTVEGWTEPDQRPPSLLLKGSRLRRWIPNVVEGWIGGMTAVKNGDSIKPKRGPGRPRKGV